MRGNDKRKAGMTEQTDGSDKSDPYLTPTLILPPQGGGDVEVQSSLYKGGGDVEVQSSLKGGGDVEVQSSLYKGEEM